MSIYTTIFLSYVYCHGIKAILLKTKKKEREKDKHKKEKAHSIIVKSSFPEPSF